MKRFFALFAGCAGVLTMLGCTDETPNPFTIVPDTVRVMTLDDFEDGNAQNAIGALFGTYKVANMGNPGAAVSWGGGYWYAYASENGGRVFSGAGDTIIDSAGTSQDDTLIIQKLMTGGKLYAELNCQGCTGIYYAGIGCVLAGDYSNAYMYDTLKDTTHGAIYWDFSSLDSVRIKMRGIGSILFFFESRAVKNKFLSPDEAWGFHGDSLNFGDVMADTASYYSFSVKNFKTFSTEAATVSWDEAKTGISSFVFELNTESDDRLEIEIDKIEFVGLDTNAVFPFISFK